jgi:hypothetical protein
MTQDLLAQLIFAGGVCQLGILTASALVPFRLNWRDELRGLTPLHRQMYWTYGGYVVLAIISLGLICLFNSAELASGSGLARGVCAYIAVFWGCRVSLQPLLKVKPHLTLWWLRLGYHSLTVVFTYLAIVFGWAAVFPPQ